MKERWEEAAEAIADLLNARGLSVGETDRALRMVFASHLCATVRTSADVGPKLAALGAQCAELWHHPLMAKLRAEYCAEFALKKAQLQAASRKVNR